MAVHKSPDGIVQGENHWDASLTAVVDGVVKIEFEMHAEKQEGVGPTGFVDKFIADVNDFFDDFFHKNNHKDNPVWVAISCYLDGVAVKPQRPYDKKFDHAQLGWTHSVPVVAGQTVKVRVEWSYQGCRITKFVYNLLQEY